MRDRLIVGIIDIVVGLACFILCIVLIAMGLGIVTAYISDKKQKRKEICWRNPTKKEMAKIPGTNIRVNRKCCENCAYVEFYTVRGSQTINKICTWNPVCPIIGNHGRHVCPNWCPGAGSVVFKIEE